MKKFFLLCIAALIVQANLFSMKRLPEETVELKYTKKTKVSTLQPGAMTYTLKKSNDTLTLSPAAVKLCDALVDVSNIEGFNSQDYFTGVFSEQQTTDYEAIALFDILNTITQSAKHITINEQTAYFNHDVANITLQKIKQHNLYSLDGLKKIINVCDFLICPVVLNACARIIIESKTLIKQKSNVFGQFSDNSGVIPFLEKHLKRIDFGAQIHKYIHEFSVFDYIILNGIPNIQPECYIFDNKRLTSLDGLEALTLLFQQQFSQVITIMMSNNYLNLVDLTQLQKFFSHLPQLQRLYLDNNYLTQLPENIFNNLTQLRMLFLTSNKLTQLPENIFNNLIELQALNLENNKFTQLPENIFNNLIELQALGLNNNELTQLPENIFNNLTKLQTLYLNHNELTQLPKGIFDSLTQLQGLYLNHNELTQLPKHIFDNLIQLRTLLLDDNPLEAASEESESDEG